MIKIQKTLPSLIKATFNQYLYLVMAVLFISGCDLIKKENKQDLGNDKKYYKIIDNRNTSGTASTQNDAGAAFVGRKAGIKKDSYL